MEKHEKKKKYDIAFLNILFCMMVVFIHISSEIITNMDHSNTLFWAVYVLSKLSGFAVSGFILLSGVKLMLKSDNIHYGKFYVSRLLSVVVPYVIWVFLYYAYFCYIGYYRFSWRDLGHYILFGDLWAHFYFIIVIVQFYILAPIWIFLFRRANPAVVLVIALIITTLSGNMNDIVQTITGRTVEHTDIVFTRYLFYWAAGCMIGVHYDKFTDYLRRRWISITLMFFVCTAVDACFTVKCIGSSPYWLSQIHMLYSVGAILFWYMTAQLLTVNGTFLLRPFAEIDKITYHIYLIHCLVLIAANNYMTGRGITDLTVRYEWRAVIVYGGSILLCMLWYVSKSMLKKLIHYA